MKKLLLGMTIALMTLTATLYAACTADVDMGSNKITNLGEPSVSSDAATKGYVDANTGGLRQYAVTCEQQGNETNTTVPRGIYSITSDFWYGIYVHADSQTRSYSYSSIHDLNTQISTFPTSPGSNGLQLKWINANTLQCIAGTSLGTRNITLYALY
jgi:hypothetical protein